MGRESRQTMKIGIVDADLLDNGTRFPNLALMKISAYEKQQGNHITLIEDWEECEDYQLVYVGRVFTFTKVPLYIYNNEKFVLGGTGFEELDCPLEHHVEHHMPDYELYKDYIDKQINIKGIKRSYFKDYLDYSVGFTTRGCFRKCEFCVNKKYNKVVVHSPIAEFLNTNRPYISLWDDNFLAYSNWREVLQELKETNKRFQFRQGLDIRLMTEKKAQAFSQVKYHGDFIFAFDYIKDKEIIIKKIRLWQKYNKKIAKFYVLCAYESQDIKDIINTFERIKILMEHNSLPYIMRYEKYKESEYRGIYIQLARWCNQPAFFKKTSFRDFINKQQKTIKTQNYISSSLRALRLIEENHPEVAKKYFDMRFDKKGKKGE